MAKEETVRVKFNYAFMNPSYDSKKAMKVMKEEKSYQAYMAQRAIDYAMVDFVFKEGTVHEISKDLFEKLSTRQVETYNNNFGAFQGATQKYADRKKIPFLLRVNEMNDLLNPYEAELDLYPKQPTGVAA